MINNYQMGTKIDQLLDLVEMGKTLFGLIMAHNIQVRKVSTLELLSSKKLEASPGVCVCIICVYI